MERGKKRMEMQSSNGGGFSDVNWPDLPTEIVGLITKKLGSNHKDVRNFRAVCKKWRRATLFTAFLPRLVTNSSVPEKVILSSIFLLRPPLHSPHLPPLMLLAVESTQGSIQYFHPFSKTPILNLPKNFNITRFRPTQLTTEFHVVVDEPDYQDHLFSSRSCCYDKVLMFCDSWYPSIRNYTMFSLSNGDRLAVSFPFDKYAKDKPFSFSQINDVIDYKGDRLILEKQQGLLKYDVCAYNKSTTLVYQGISKLKVKGKRRNRLVVSSSGEKLFLIVPKDVRVGRKKKTWLHVYELKKNTTSESGFWEEISSFGDDEQVLFVSKYHCFFVAAFEFSTCQLKDCIVFSDDAFPLCSKSGWNYGNKGGIEVSVFCLNSNDRDNSLDLDANIIPELSMMLCHWQPPDWVSHISSFDSQLEREPEAEEILKSDSNSEEVASLLMELHRRRRSSSRSGCFEQTTEVPTTSAAPDQDGISSSAMNDVERVVWEDQDGVSSSAMNDVERVVWEAPESETQREGGPHSVCRAYITSTNQSNGSNTTTAKFEGLDIRSNLVPTLQKIWANHGKIIDNCVISNGDMISRALELVATVVLTLEENSALSLSDCQAEYLRSALSDLNCMCFSVDWLVPYVEKALKLQQSKPLMDSLRKFRELKAQASARKSKLLDELAKLDDFQKELDEDMSKMSKMIPFAGEVDIEKPVGAGLT